MVKRDGGNAASKTRSNGDNAALRNRIEGFGNGPMPPPIDDTFEDRLHNALASDETIGEWYTSARASVDAMATAFDNAVNNIADAIEDTVAAVVGDEDPWEEPAPKTNGQRGQGKKNQQGKEDNSERSGVKWDEVVASIIEGGDLETFVLNVRAQCANIEEEREVADVLAQHLIDSQKNSSTLRILHVMQAVIDGDLPNVRDQIRIKAAAKLEKLQTQGCFKSLSVEVLGRTGSASSSQQNASAAAPPADLLSMEAPQTAAKASAEKQQPMDLLDASAQPAPLDLLDSVAAPPISSPAPAGSTQNRAAPKAKAQVPDLLSLAEPAASSTIPGLQPPPKSGVSPLAPPPSAGTGNLVDLMSTTTPTPAPQLDLFAQISATGMPQGAPAAKDDGFNPNAKNLSALFPASFATPAVGGYAPPAAAKFAPPVAPAFSPPAAAVKPPIMVKTSPASSDPFAGLVSLPGASGTVEATSKSAGLPMNSMMPSMNETKLPW